MTKCDVAYLGKASDGRDTRISMLEAQKFSVGDNLAAPVSVLDGTEMTDAEVDQLLAEINTETSATLVIFKLSHGVTFRDRRSALLAAGAKDVMAVNAPDEDFLRRGRALILLSRAPRILAVEDEDEIGDWIEKHLVAAGMDVSRAANLAEAEARFEAGPIDALVVDRKLPDGDGLSLVARLRGNGIRTPALFLSAYNSIEDRLKGLEEAGADDYIGKPVHQDELCARVRLILRPLITDDVLIFGPLEINRKDQIARWRGERVELRRKECELLIYLAERADLPIPQRMIYLDVWQKMYMDVEVNPITAAKFRLMKVFKTFLAERGEVCPEFIIAVDDAYVFQTEPLLRLPAQVEASV